MGQRVDNGLNNINIADNYIKEQNFAAWKDNDNKINTQATGEAGGLGYSYVHGEKSDKLKNTTMDNFEEYLRNKQDKAKEAGVDQASQNREDKENAKEIARNLSSEEIKQLKVMGIDVSSASLDDIMGMVNTMRGNAHREEMQAMMAQITAGNGDMDGVTVVGGSVKVAGTDIKLDNVSVVDVATAETENVAPEAEKEFDRNIENSNEKMSKEPIAQTEFSMSDNDIVYIMKNDLPLTKENLYKAHYSGSKAEINPMSHKLMKDMMPQIEKVIEQAGLQVDEESLKGAKFLIDNELPVTTDNLKKYINYQEYQGKDVGEIDFTTVEMPKQDKALKLYNDVKNIQPVVAYEMAMEGKTITIASMTAYMESHKIKGYDLAEFEQGDVKAITAMRQVEEIRLSMTMEASVRLINQDFNIDTREISKIVAQLKDMEQQMITNKLINAQVEPTEANISLYQEMNTKVQSLGELHARILASPIKGGDFTVNALHYEANITVNPDNFEAVRRSYEAVGTAPRGDMGDSIAKAFSNVKAILGEMNMPVNPETERAVRILGYNSIEITEANINQVMNIDRQVNDLINTFYPEAVLGMIKDGINPLDVPIDELNKKIKSKNYNKGVSEADNFASYLRDMEAMGEISPEERESYIGIYRVINKLEKSGDREAGWLFANGERLTVRNLVSAMRSRRASGMDITVDEGFGFLEQIDKKGKAIDTQIEKAFVGDNASIEEQIDEASAELKTLADVTEAVEEFMVENQIELTAINVSASTIMMDGSGGIYQLVSDILSKMKFVSHSKDDMVDEETENMTDSMSGEDVSVDFSMDSILENLRGREEMSLKYEDLRDKLTEMMYGASMTGSITSKDISAIKMISAGFNIMSGMAKQAKYQIPVSTESGIKVMNLIISHDTTNKGMIDISVAGDTMGQINAKVKVAEDGSIVGYVTSSTSEGNYTLMDYASKIVEDLALQGFDGEGIKLGAYENISDDMATAGEENLYRASVAMVKVLSEVIS